MNIEFISITEKEDASLPFMKELYELAFPEKERRTWPSFLSLLKNEREMHVVLIRSEGRDAGMVVWWKISGWLFIEHLAIDETARGGGIGATVMQHYLKAAGGKMILEVEPPTTTDAKRRIRFYERLGLTIHAQPYVQPSYRDAAVSYPMLLMTSAGADSSTDFEAMVVALKKLVYFR